MPLDKNDIKQIKAIVDESFNQLSIMIGNAFDHVDKRFNHIEKRLDTHDKRFDQHDQQFRNINARLDLIEIDLSNLRNLHKEVREIRELLDEVVTRSEFTKLEKRLARVERHLGFAK